MPFGLGGNRIWAWSFIALLTGFLLVWTTFAVKNIPSLKTLRPLPELFLLLIAGLILQLFLPGDMQIWQKASAVLEEDLVQRATINPSATIQTIIKWITYAAIGWISYVLAKQHGKSGKLMRGFAIITAVYALYALIAYANNSFNILFWFKFAYLKDVTGPFVNRNSYATYAALGGLVSLHWVFITLRGMKTYKHKRWQKVLVETMLRFRISVWLPVSAFILNVAALLLTHSRGGFAAFFVGLLTFVGVWTLQRKDKIALKRAVWPLFALFTLGLWMLTSGGEVTLKRMENTTTDWAYRKEFYEITWTAAQNHLLYGTGAGTYQDAIRPYKEVNRKTWNNRTLDRAHNTYLQALLELGLPLFTVWVAFGLFLLSFFPPFSKQEKSIINSNWMFPAIGAYSLAALYSHALVDFSMEMPAIAGSVCFLVGISLAKCKKTVHKSKSRQNKQVIASFCVGIILFAAGLTTFLATKHMATEEGELHSLRYKSSILSKGELSLIAEKNQKGLNFYNLPQLHGNVALAQLELARRAGTRESTLTKMAYEHLKQQAKSQPQNAFVWSQMAHTALMLREYVTATNALALSIQIDITSPRLMFYRLELASVLWPLATVKQKQIFQHQYKIAYKYNSKKAEKLAREYPSFWPNFWPKL